MAKCWLNSWFLPEVLILVALTKNTITIGNEIHRLMSTDIGKVYNGTWKGDGSLLEGGHLNKSAVDISCDLCYLTHEKISFYVYNIATIIVLSLRCLYWLQYSEYGHGTALRWQSCGLWHNRWVYEWGAEPALLQRGNINICYLTACQLPIMYISIRISMAVGPVAQT